MLGTSRRRYTLHRSRYVLMTGWIFSDDRSCCSASRNNPVIQTCIYDKKERKNNINVYRTYTTDTTNRKEPNIIWKFFNNISCGVSKKK